MNQPAPQIPGTPPGMNVPQIEDALRELATTAVAEEARVAARYGGALPDFSGYPTARAVALPISTACREGYAKLASHLVALIGHRAAAEICGRISHDVQDEAASLAAQPATNARH